MSTIAVVLCLITITANAVMAVADLVGARFVLANSAAVGVPRSWLPMLGLAKAAGAAIALPLPGADGLRLRRVMCGSR
ncbi:DoxX family protein [Kribbella sp. NBC_01505]|uniref:DoxX family protein n=1 Tax=Kribbella sp. NBC_01505 TaxID=2903580 RepID=UPI00386FB1E5